MIDQFSATIDKIYAAAGGQAPWTQALHSVEELTGSVGAVIGFVPVDASQRPFNIAGRFTAEQCATYSQSYQHICRRTRYMIDHPDEDAIYDALLITEQEMNTDPVYDWFGRHDLRYFVGGALPRTRSHHPIFSLQRSPAQGHVQPADVRLFKQVRSHLGRAITLADQLGSLGAVRRFAVAVLEALPQALFALDGDGRVVFANDSAAALMRSGDGLAVADDRLRTASSGDQAALDTLIAGAAAMVPVGSGWTSVSRPSGRAPLALFVTRLRVEADEAPGAGFKVLVVVHDAANLRSPDPQTLVSLYGLTDTEARLASAIAAGHSLESAAASLHMQVGTARTHLKSIFAKLDVNRQQDLVRLLTSLASVSLQAKKRAAVSSGP